MLATSSRYSTACAGAPVRSSATKPTPAAPAARRNLVMNPPTRWDAPLAPVCHRALGRANERALPVEDGEPRRLSQQYPCPHEQECSASSADVAGAILRLLASDGGAPAPRRPPARTAPGGGFGRGAEPPSELSRPHALDPLSHSHASRGSCRRRSHQPQAHGPRGARSPARRGHLRLP